MGRKHSGSSRRNEWDGDDAVYRSSGSSWEDEEYGADDEWEQSSSDRALITSASRYLSAAQQSETIPLIVPGDGVPMGAPFIKRRERPLTMRITVFSLMAAILVTGIFATTPMGSSASGQVNAFQALAGAMIF